VRENRRERIWSTRRATYTKQSHRRHECARTRKGDSKVNLKKINLAHNSIGKAGADAQANLKNKYSRNVMLNLDANPVCSQRGCLTSAAVELAYRVRNSYFGLTILVLSLIIKKM
jgi:hypothetical protein